MFTPFQQIWYNPGMDTVLTFCEEDGRRSFPLIMDGICRYARMRKWHIENLSSKDRPLKLERILAFWRPIGCMVERNSGPELPASAFGTIPVVYFNRTPHESGATVSVVEMDHAACIRTALAELQAMHPACYGFVPFHIPSRGWNIAREQAFASQLSASESPFHLFRPRTAREVSRVSFIRQLRPWLRKLSKPCAILAANDETASVVVVACSMEDLKIPDDVSVIGIDDDQTICLNTTPTLSSVRPNFTQGAFLAARLLDRAIRHPGLPRRHVVYPPEGVTRRESTLFFAHKDSEVSAAVALITAKACTSLTADDVRRTFSCAPRTADERFRAATRQSILEMIHAVRLSRMKGLLANPLQQLDAIANLCGYASQNAACRFFRRKTGVTMTSWRQTHLGLRSAPEP